MIQLFHRGVVPLAFSVMLYANCSNIVGHDIIKRDKESFIVSFVLLNYSHICNNIYAKDGAYLQSLLNELGLQPTTEAIKSIEQNLSCSSDAYGFAMNLIKTK